MLDALKFLRNSWFSGGLKFFRDFGILSGGHVVVKVIGFLVFAFLARTLYPEGYGAVEYLVGLSVFFATLVDGGLGAVGLRHIARQSVDLPALAAQVPVARLGLALVSVPLMVLVAAPATHDPAGRRLVWLFALSLLAAPWRQDWLLWAQIAGLVSIGVFGVPLVLALGGRGAAVVSVVASIAVWLAAHVFFRRRGGRPPAFTMTLVPGGLAFGVIGASRMLGLDHWAGVSESSCLRSRHRSSMASSWQICGDLVPRDATDQCVPGTFRRRAVTYGAS